MNILVADDHELFLSGIQSLIRDTFSDIKITSVASLNEIEKQLKQSHTFQLLLVDLFMPGMQGTTSIRKLTHAYPTIPLIVISAEDSPSTIQACLHAGASGYALKSANSNTIIQAITSVLAGGQFIPIEARNHKALNISHRQEEVLICIAKGKSNREIAQHLNITEGTVKQYVSGLLKMLNVDNRTRAAAKAQETFGLTIKQ